MLGTNQGWRLNGAFLMLLVLGILILSRVYLFATTWGEPYRQQSIKENLRLFELPANRGDIYDCQMNLLASSVPLYELRVDFGVQTMADTAFNRQVDELATGLEALFGDIPRLAWKAKLIQARYAKHPSRYWLLRKEVSFGTMAKVRKLPLLRDESNMRGGLVVVQTNRRVMPYGDLAARTIGYLKNDTARIGIEKGLDTLLAGQPGLVLKQRMGGGVWKPLGDGVQRQPRHGKSVVTTLDIRLQEIAHESLVHAMHQHQARLGCALLLETATGKVRAMVNLVKNQKGDGLGEWNQVAYGYPVEPGSVFKLASLMAGLADGYWTLSDTVDMGSYQFTAGSYQIQDDHRYGSRMSVEEIFSKSSNVGISKLLHRGYAGQPKKYFDRLRAFGLDQRMSLPLLEDPQPLYRDPENQGWSVSDLYSTGIGYSMQITPLQLLTFYNAVVNGGIRQEPSLVEGRAKTQGKRILEKSQAEAARRMMRRVAIDGTVKEQMKGLTFGIGGKTGTARLRNAQGATAANRHRAMFIGYFPDPDPQYTCLVMIEEPSAGAYYASLVAAPVFRDIAEQTMALKEFRGNSTKALAQHQSLQSTQPSPPSDLSSLDQLVGMEASAAVWALERQGYTVSVQGSGRVRRCMGNLQNHKPGQRVTLLLGS
ncbi:MAG: peptidoglycan D,D-transpeptidase FtsI family protein [Bacteroidia bacterium]|jgi:cell division protein FtsI (penicillin-binding protein 3)